MPLIIKKHTNKRFKYQLYFDNIDARFYRTDHNQCCYVDDIRIGIEQIDWVGYFVESDVLGFNGRRTSCSTRDPYCLELNDYNTVMQLKMKY